MKKEIKILMKKLKELPDFPKVKFIMLFGSQASGKANAMSDYDFAFYYEGSKKERFNFRINLGAKLPQKYDIQVLQDLPLYIQKEVLKGKIIYVENFRFLH